MTQRIDMQPFNFEKNISDMTEGLPEKLRKVRVSHDYSQEYVAEKIGVSLSSYSRYEKGSVTFDFYSIEKIAGLYKMSLDELIHYGEDRQITAQRQDRTATVSILVELDGRAETLTHWINRLTAINQAI